MLFRSTDGVDLEKLGAKDFTSPKSMQNTGFLKELENAPLFKGTVKQSGTAWDYRQFSSGYGSAVPEGTVLTEEQASKLLAKDIKRFEAELADSDWYKVETPDRAKRVAAKGIRAAGEVPQFFVPNAAVEPEVIDQLYSLDFNDKGRSQNTDEFMTPKSSSSIKDRFDSPLNDIVKSWKNQSSSLGQQTSINPSKFNSQQFSSVLASLGKPQKQKVFSSYEPEEYGFDEEPTEDSSEPEDDEIQLAALEKLSGKTEYSEEPSEMEEEPEEDSLLAKTLEPKEDEEDGYAVKPKRFYSNLYKRLGKSSV